MDHRFRSSLRKWHFTLAFLAGFTVLILCVAGGSPVEQGATARFEVKDTNRFTEGWAYFGFGSGGARSKERAQPFAKSACCDCHRQKGGLDNVFIQFYPVLRATLAK